MPRSTRRAMGMGTGTTHHSPPHSRRIDGSAPSTRAHCCARSSPSCSPQRRSRPYFRERTMLRQPASCAPSRTTADNGHDDPAHAAHAKGGQCSGAFRPCSVAPHRRHHDPSESAAGMRMGRTDANSSRSSSAQRRSQRRARTMRCTPYRAAQASSVFRREFRRDQLRPAAMRRSTVCRMPPLRK